MQIAALMPEVGTMCPGAGKLTGYARIPFDKKNEKSASGISHSEMHTVCGKPQFAKRTIWRKCKGMGGCITHPPGCMCHPISGCNRHPQKLANSGRFEDQIGVQIAPAISATVGQLDPCSSC